MVLWLAATAEVSLGGKTFFFRDVLTTHAPFKAFGATELKAGRIPAFNTSWGLGQPFRGNPNTLAFYPGNLLYLILPWWSAFNLHYCLHWLLAAFSMWFLARRLGQSSRGAFLASITYAGGGYLLSSLSFYNLLGVVAWWPMVMAAALRGGRRGLALGGIACGLALLCGEPVTATLGLVPLLLIAIQSHGWRRGVLTCFGIGVVGLLVAAPQVVATGRILSSTVRGSGLAMALSDSGGAYSLNPWRMLELVLPFPFGRPGDFGTSGYWSDVVTPRVPYILTLYSGIVAVGLAATVVRRRLRWTVLGLAGVTLAMVGGWGGDLLQRTTMGLLRYPEKFLFWFALAIALLAGWGLERVLAHPGPFTKGAVVAGSILAAMVAIGFPLGEEGQWSSWIEQLFDPLSYPGIVEQQQAQLVITLTLLSVVLFAAAIAAKRQLPAGLVATQLAGLLLLAPLLMTAERDLFATPPWATLLEPGANVVTATFDSPFREPAPGYRMIDTSYLARMKIATADLDPAAGVLSGLNYPMAPNLEGMHSALFGELLARLPGLDWPGRLAWLRVLGVDAIVSATTPPDLGLRVLSTRREHAVRTQLLEIPSPLPEARWPSRLIHAPDLDVAFALVADHTRSDSAVVTAGSQHHESDGRINHLHSESDRVEMEVSSRGGVLVLQRAYWPILRATSDAGPLSTLPVDVGLTGIEVPQGSHRVTVDVDNGPVKRAGLLSVIVSLLALWTGLRPTRQSPRPGSVAS